jgi:Tfp pilus assembly PilM family ATPase
MKTDAQRVRSAKSVIVVEPGSDWFKLVRVDSLGNNPVVSRLALLRLEEDHPATAESLRRAVGDAGAGRVPVVLCLPRQMVTLRLFELPSVDPREIADMIDLQIARHTPYSRDEITLDYRLMKAERPGYSRVLLVIAQTGMLRHRFRMAEDAGLTVDAVTVTTEGILAGVPTPEGDGSARVLLDVDAGYTDMSVLRAGALVFSRSIMVGARDLIGQREKWEPRFLQEVRRGLEACRSETPGIAFSRLVLAGAAARLPWVGERLGAELDLPVESIDLLKSVPVRPGAVPEQQPGAQEVSVTGLVGAALAPSRLEINLMPESVQQRRLLVDKARMLSDLGVLAVAATMLLSFWMEVQQYRRVAYLDVLKARIAATEPEAKAVEAMRNRIARVAARMNVGVTPMRLLAELHRVTPPSIYYDVITSGPGEQMTLRGGAEAVSDILRLVSALEESPLFHSARSTRTSTVRGRTEFEVTCSVEKKLP